MLDPETLNQKAFLPEVQLFCEIEDGDLLLFGNNFVQDTLPLLQVRLGGDGAGSDTMLAAGTCYIEEVSPQTEARIRVSVMHAIAHQPVFATAPQAIV